MDDQRFDDLTRRLATGGATRRRFLRNLGGVVAGAAVVGVEARSARAAQDATSEPEAAPCDGCNWVCSNCPIGCCMAFGNSHFKPRHP